jgi:hypothetical protein
VTPNSHQPPTCDTCGTPDAELIRFPNADDMVSETADEPSVGAVYQCLDVQACQRRQADIIRR